MIDAENQNPKDGGSFTSLHTDPKNLFDEEGMPSPLILYSAISITYSSL
uniref:Uncharacterized protein n=1 Tax=Chlamydia pneumoniae TaxID=83558 RepID=A0A0F7WQN3_CHLPN|nr:Uncharacterized protein BN1224_DC9_BS_00430 [Chlamydia pneumoniae]